MAVLRLIVGILVGYLVFASASMALVGFVTTREGPVALLAGLAGLAAAGVAAGLLTAMVAGAKARVAGFVVAGLIGLATLANLVMALGAEPLWYKLGTLLLTAPLTLVVCLRRGSPAPVG